MGQARTSNWKSLDQLQLAVMFVCSVSYLVPLLRFAQIHWTQGVPLTHSDWVAKCASDYPEIERWVVGSWHGPLYGDPTVFFYFVPVMCSAVAMFGVLCAKVCLKHTRRSVLLALAWFGLSVLLLGHQATMQWLFD